MIVALFSEIFSHRAHVKVANSDSAEYEAKYCRRGVGVDLRLAVGRKVYEKLPHHDLNSSQSCDCGEWYGSYKGQDGYVNKQFEQRSIHIKEGHRYPLADDIACYKCRAQGDESRVVIECCAVKRIENPPASETAQYKEIESCAPVDAGTCKDYVDAEARPNQQGSVGGVENIAHHRQAAKHQCGQCYDVDETHPEHDAQCLKERHIFLVPEKQGDSSRCRIVVDNVQEIARAFERQHFLVCDICAEPSEKQCEAPGVEQENDDYDCNNRGDKTQEIGVLQGEPRSGQIGCPTDIANDDSRDKPRKYFFHKIQSGHKVDDTLNEVKSRVGISQSNVAFIGVNS